MAIVHNRVIPALTDHDSIIQTSGNNKVMMTESIPNTEDFKFPVYKFDRKDVYRPCGTYENINTLSTIIRYKVIEVNCNPDRDW